MIENINNIRSILSLLNKKLWVLLNNSNSDYIFSKYISRKIYTLSMCFITPKKTYLLINDLDKDNIVNKKLLIENNVKVIIYNSKQDLKIKIEDIIAELGFISPISLSYSSIGDKDTDILGHGEYIELVDMLKIPYIKYKKKFKVESAEEIIYNLLGKKTNIQIQRITLVKNITHDILETTFKTIKVGMSEIDVRNHIIKLTKSMTKKYLSNEIKSISLAWENCPFVLFGKNLEKGGHTLPSLDVLEEGETVYIDFGICLRYNEEEVYSDIQRMGYTLKKGEKKAPLEIQNIFNTLKSSIDKGMEIMKPGVKAFEVDEIVRNEILKKSYPNYNHATGHPVGLRVHDVGAIISNKINKKSNLELVENSIYTLEPRIAIYNGGSIEEMMIVTEYGAKFLGKSQEKLYII